MLQHPLVNAQISISKARDIMSK